jgi:hypothetical protein
VTTRVNRRRCALGLAVVAAIVLTSCSPVAQDPAPAPVRGGTEGGPSQVSGDVVPTAVCDRQQPGPAEPPPGAIVVDPAVVADLSARTAASPPGSTFWLAPGTHTLTPDEYSQVTPKDGNTYIGAPGAIFDGAGLNNYAFTGVARDVTIRHLTVRGFTPPQDQGVVNHNSGPGWVIEHNTIEDNRGAGMMAGARQQVRWNCLRDNGQYGMNAYQPDNAIVDLVVEFNEITGNNVDDWETRSPGCGCTGGVKFWAVDGADVRSNWVHDNRGPGLWADTNNNDFLIEGNVIEGNDSSAVFYETSYNMVMRDNVVRRNAMVQGKAFADEADDFPVGAVYISESGGEPRVPARTDLIEITGNVFEDNWSGITAWENADRFCNSAANTSIGNCTLLVPDTARCAQPAIASEPLYSDCRWRTQRLDVHDNTFVTSPDVVGCAPGYTGRMAILSNFGTYPDWSPYQADVVQRSIVADQENRWRDNDYRGTWTFMIGVFGQSFTVAQWQSAPYGQDVGSTFEPDPSGSPC